MTNKARRAGEPSKETVRVTIRLPLDTFRLLEDVALSHSLDDTAAVATHQAPTSQSAHSVERVIADLIERHSAELENHARTVRSPVRR